MRSVIRVNLVNLNKDIIFDWSDDSDYSKCITEYFEQLGYTNVGLSDELCKRMWESVPKDVSEEEKPRVTFTSYTSDGQSHFVVVPILKDRIHIRSVANTFQRTSRACVELNTRILRHSKKSKNNQLYGILHHRIHVLEHGQSIPTIHGTVMNNSFKWTIKNKDINTLLLLASIIFMMVDYFFPSLNWPPAVLPALTVMLLTNLVPIMIEFAKIKKSYPIYWDAKLELTD